MTRSTGTVDYAAILKGLPVATRQTLFKKLIDGSESPQGHQPGIAEQYVSALVEHRSMEDRVAVAREYNESDAFKGLPEKIQEEAHEQLGQMAWMLEQRRQGLVTIATELARLQATMGEIDGAGTAPAP